MLVTTNLTAAEYDAALQHGTWLNQRSKAARGCKLVMVLRWNVADAARAVGCSRQAVNAARLSILRATRACPACGRPHPGPANTTHEPR